MMEQTTIEQCVEPNLTIREMWQRGTKALEQAGIRDAKENCEGLILHILSINRTQLLMNWMERFPSELLSAWQSCLERKLAGEPMQYIIGSGWFYNREFTVNPSVLIPRPETELLVEAIINAGRTLWSLETDAPVVLDVGTGSGAIALTLKAENPSWQVIASDLSEDALQVAQQNADKLGLASQVTWRQGDLLQPFIGRNGLYDVTRPIDILVSNPPYIPASDMNDLQPEVKDYEPHLALVGGVDGLDPYRQMLNDLQKLEMKPRIVGFELGIHQPPIVAQLMREMGAWDTVEIITDYNGIERHVLAIRTR